MFSRARSVERPIADGEGEEFLPCLLHCSFFLLFVLSSVGRGRVYHRLLVPAAAPQVSRCNAHTCGRRWQPLKSPLGVDVPCTQLCRSRRCRATLPSVGTSFFFSPRHVMHQTIHACSLGAFSLQFFFVFPARFRFRFHSSKNPLQQVSLERLAEDRKQLYGGNVQVSALVQRRVRTRASRHSRTLTLALTLTAIGSGSAAEESLTPRRYGEGDYPSCGIPVLEGSTGTL